MIYFYGCDFKASPETEKSLEWLIKNREFIEFCMDAGLPIPTYQSSNQSTKENEQ